MYIKYKSERGSMAVYVTVVLLTMLIILSSLYMATASVRKNQLTAAVMIKKAYESDNNNAEKIYNSLTGGSSSGGQEEPELPPVDEYVTDGLILHYDAINNTGNGHSDTTTTWTDLSGNGNDATITGGTWSDKYLSFTTSNGLNGVETKNNFPINFLGKTFNIVFNLTQVSSVEALFGARNSQNDGFMLFNYDKDDALEVDTIGDQTRVKLGERLSADRNYNLTVTFDNGTVKLYIDGALISTTSYTTGTINFPLTVFTAGTRSNSLGNVYSVKVYDRALTEDEVLQNNNVDRERFYQLIDENSYVTDDLVLHYDAINNTGNGHIETTTTWADLSGNGNDLTLSNFANSSTSGWTEKTLNFDGINDFGTVSSLQQVLSGNVTISTRIYSNKKNNYRGIYGNYKDTSYGVSGILAQYQDGVMRIGYNGNIVNLNYDLTTNRYITLTVQMGTDIGTKVYINGELVGQEHVDSNLAQPEIEFWIGKSYNLTNRYFEGKMNNFLVYDRILSEAEIKKNYSADIKRFGEEPEISYVKDGLILHYDAINNTGNGHSNTTTTWTDLSGNGSDATVTGGMWSDNYVRFTTSNNSNGIKTKSNFPINFSSKTFNIVFNLSQVSTVEALFGARTSTSNGFMLFNYNVDNAFELDTIGGQTRVKLGNRLSANRNYNLTVTFDNGIVKLYIDGALISTTSYTTGTINFPLTVFTAGTRSNSLGNVYSVKVYDRALTEDEVLQNYNMDKVTYGV